MQRIFQSTGETISTAMLEASLGFNKAGGNISSVMKEVLDEIEELNRRKVVKRLVRSAVSKAVKEDAASRLRSFPVPVPAGAARKAVLPGPSEPAGGAGEGHLVTVASWQEGAAEELLCAYRAFSAYEVVRSLETTETEPAMLSSGGFVRFRPWACRLKGWLAAAPGTPPSAVILGTYGVLKCMSGFGPTPSEKSIKYQAHQYMKNLNAVYYGLEYMGHGPPDQKTSGNGFMVSAGKLRIVMRQAIDSLGQKFPGVPIFLHGECYGAMLSLSLMLDEQLVTRVSGLIHSGAPLHRRGITQANSILSRSVVQLADWLLPPWYTQRFLEQEKIGPMPGWFFAESPQTWNDSLRLADHVLRNIRAIMYRVPTLGVYAKEDPLVKTSRMMSMFSELLPAEEGDASRPAGRPSGGGWWRPRASAEGGAVAAPTGRCLGLSMMVCLDEEDRHLVRESPHRRDLARKVECTWMRMVLDEMQKPISHPVNSGNPLEPELH